MTPNKVLVNYTVVNLLLDQVSLDKRFIKRELTDTIINHFLNLISVLRMEYIFVLLGTSFEFFSSGAMVIIVRFSPQQLNCYTFSCISVFLTSSFMRKWK